MIRMYANFDNVKFIQLIDSFPMMRGKILATLAYEGKHILYSNYASSTSASSINYNGKTRDRRGRRLTSYSVMPPNYYRAVVKSYPLNLFEYGRTLPNGVKEPGRFILRDKTRMKLEPKVQRLADAKVDEVLRDTSNTK